MMDTKSRTYYRFRFNAIGLCLFASFAALYFLTEIIKAVNANEPSAVVIVLLCVLTILFLIPAIRFPFNGAVATPSALTIRNIVRTHVVKWEEIERFELTRHDPWPRVAVVVLKTGKHIPMTGVQAVPYERSPVTKFAKNTVASLNERLIVQRQM